MTPSEYEAFSAVFTQWDRRRWQGIGEVRADEQTAPAALVNALRGLGYRIVNRGTMPPGVEW